ncbi:hypothetical protein FS837_012590 [Tulasnella sp. UAMH 9824]|nr:hypothetical protein FS837_012590 [Tulasnella sp. UAMH 9824]
MSSDLQSLVDTIAEQEESLRFPYFSADVAWEIGSAVRERFMNARSQGRFQKQGCVIHISTCTGQTLFSAAAGEESAIGPVNWKYIEGKKEVARNWNHSSFYVGRHALLKGWPKEEYAFGGGFPIWIKGSPSAPLAIIVVSGLAEEDDHQLIVDTLSDYIPRMKPVGWRVGRLPPIPTKPARHSMAR